MRAATCSWPPTARGESPAPSCIPTAASASGSTGTVIAAATPADASPGASGTGPGGLLGDGRLDGRPALRPGQCSLQLGRDAQESGLVPWAGDQLNADGNAVGGGVSGKGDGGLAGHVEPGREDCHLEDLEGRCAAAGFLVRRDEHLAGPRR